MPTSDDVLADVTAQMQEFTQMNEKVMRGVENFKHIDADDIEIGPTPKTAVYSEDKLTLYKYEPLTDETLDVPPVLITYALVNRPYMVDLQEDLSLVRNLLNLGLEVYLIDWGYPTRVDRYLTLDDYINGYIDNCVDVIRTRHGLDKINLLGICQGGVFSMCYSSLHPDKIQNLITMVAPVDFHVEPNRYTGLLNAWAKDMDADLMVEALGNVPGDLMNYGYLLLKPFSLSFQKYISMIDILDNEDKLVNFLRMEKWIFDSPDQAGEAWKQFIQDFYQNNKFIKGEVQIGEGTVDLKNLTMPVLNLYAERDHLVPPVSTQALGEYVGTDDYTVEGFPVGHIGMYVSSRVQKSLPPTIVEWLKARTPSAAAAQPVGGDGQA
jgi:polyhydroxyalkanoate synthase